MCYIPKEIRRERYKQMKEAGFTYGWRCRARDFTQIRFIQAMNGGRRIRPKGELWYTGEKYELINP